MVSNYSASMGTRCVPCILGYFLQSGACAQCLSGFYVTEAGICGQCPAGTYAPTAGALYCLLCVDNAWQPDAG